MPTFFNRVQHAWNAFMNKDPTSMYPPNYIENPSYSRPDHHVLGNGNERNIVTSVYNRMSVDGASCAIMHVQTDKDGRYESEVNSPLNYCLTLSTNLDQTATQFKQDIILSLLDEGNIAIVPIDTDDEPEEGNAFEIFSMRVGKIVEWYPNTVKVRLYNERNGKKEERVFPKTSVAIVENPFYTVMNEPNSLAKRIARKLALLDYVDEQNSSARLDLIVKLPYAIKTPGKQAIAEQRRKDIEMQLTGSKYGIAYVDATEQITQLNRPIENQLMSQIKDLKYMFYSQLGITDEIMNGTADPQTLNNYYQRTIVPILVAITESMTRSFVSKTGYTQGKRIMFFNEPFKLLPTNQIAEIADKLTRNEILTSNEVRQFIGMKPSKDPKADELRNANISASKNEVRIDKDGNNISETIRKE